MATYTQPISVGGLNQVRSNGDLFQQESERKNNQNLWASIKVGATGFGAYWGLKHLNDNVSFEADKWTSILNYSSTRNRGDRRPRMGNYSWIKEGGRLTPGDILLEGIRKVEEYSPSQILRTFQLGPLLTPSLASQKTSFYLSGRELASQKDYLSGLLKAEGNEELSNEVLKRGAFFKNNKLYLAKSSTEADEGRVLLNEARLMFPYFKVPSIDENGRMKDDIYLNKIFKNYANLYGGKFDIDASLKEGNLPFTVIGGKTAAKMNFQYGVRASARSVFQTGSKALDHGLEFTQNYVPDDTIAAKWLNSLHTNLGSSGAYEAGVRDTVLTMGKNWGVKLGLGGIAFWGLDQAVSSLAPDDSYFKNGIAAGLVGAYANTRIKFAQGVYDHTQGWKEAQENVAPGSTSLMTLAGLPLSFATAGGLAAYSKHLWDINTMGYTEAVKAATEERSAFGKYLPDVLKDAKFLKGARARRWIIAGAALGLAAEAPFIPGAILTGESSDQLRAQYSGKEEVAVKANRWWLTGGSPWGGDKTKYYRPSQAYLWMNDTKTKSLYGDRETRYKLNPFLHPIDYLRDPYQLEKMTDEERPYPIWGLDISTGSFLAKVWEKTAGALIKPDRLNPRALDTLQEQEDGSFAFNKRVTKDEASLVADGMMLAPENARADYNTEAARWSFRAFKEFAGIRGFALDQLQDAFGFDFEGRDYEQLARSGEITDIARDISELNLGDIGGLGEIQRRAILTNSGAIQKRFNNMRNKMPSWLPHDESEFYINFLEGDPYRKIDEGDVRLPGKGYESIHPELQGLDSEDYPNIYKYKILSDVALGSREFYNAKRKEDYAAAEDLLNETDAKIYEEIKKQEADRSSGKTFYEADDYKGPLGQYWRFLTHDVSELPYEKLTPIRPTSKFIHQRSAIEDYEATQLDAGDAAIWQKPYEHFISPAITQVARWFGNYKPSKTEERYNIDDYFDKLEYFKYRKLYKEALTEGNTVKADEYKRTYDKTIEGSLTTNMTSSADVLHAYIALPKRERDYFGSFINANEKDRAKIKEIVPDRIGAIYEELWNRKDIREKATDSKTGGINEEKLQDLMSAQINQENQELVNNNRKEYNTYISNKSIQKQGTFKEYLADLDSANYIQQTTGIPDQEFVGWDPRIDLKEVKIRTLSIGGQDLYDYGFYKSDLQNLKRVISVMNEGQVTNQVEAMKDDAKRKKGLEFEVRQALVEQNMNPQMVQVLDTTGKSSMTLDITQSNG